MKAPKIIRLLAYYLFKNWYRTQMQKALDYSNAKRAERMDSWLETQCYNYALTLGSRGSDFSFLFDENIGYI